MSIKRETVEERKALPLAKGVLDYFPDALLAVAEVSRVGNEQHHPGEPLHWDKSKSTDEADALLRHLLDRGKLDVDGLRHTAKVAWRALALLQRELDAESQPEACSNIGKPFFGGVVVGHEIVSEEWGTGDGEVHEFKGYGRTGDPGTRSVTEHIAYDAFRPEDEPAYVFMGMDLSSGADVTVDYRGEWPPDTRVDGRLTCCGANEHPLDCPQYRA